MLEAIQENLRFLIIEVEKQLERTAQYVKEPDRELLQAVIAGDDYVDNLKDTVQSKVFVTAARSIIDDPVVRLLRAYEVVAVNLERISDFCEHVVVQVGYVEDQNVAKSYDFEPFFDEIIAGVRGIERALRQQDTQSALAICRSEDTLDALYRKAFQRVLHDLGRHESPQSVVTMLFIAHYLERMGDSLLNVGEAILSAVLGEKIKVGQFRSLEDSLVQSDVELPAGEAEVRGTKETKSGTRTRVVTQRGSEEPSVIFKEGKTQKLREELESIERWHKLVPDIAPQVRAFHEGREDSAILFEFLRGRTLDEFMFQPSRELLDRALGCLEATLRQVMNKTRRDQPVKARFVSQLYKRVSDIQAAHPEFFTHSASLGGVLVPDYRDLIEQAMPLDDVLEAPFSTFVHGDFNVDNVIFDPDSDTIHFIDLHRSNQMDYVQDVSVFLVSNFRLQVFDGPIRSQINHTIERFTDFSLGYAQVARDVSFAARLALGLARSFATSTRFVLEPHLSKEMFYRSRYLIERLLEAHRRDSLDSFALEKEVLIG